MPQPYIKFFGVDWRSDPKLRLCSAASRGVWIDMITLMMESDRFGYLLIGGKAASVSDIAALTCTPPAVVKKAIDELGAKGVFSRDDAGVIFSRRMVRDAERQEQARNNGKMGGNPRLKGAGGGDDNGPDKPRLNGAHNRPDKAAPTGGLTHGVKTHGKPESIARSQKPEEQPSERPESPNSTSGDPDEIVWSGQVLRVPRSRLNRWKSVCTTFDVDAELVLIDPKIAVRCPLDPLGMADEWLIGKQQRNVRDERRTGSKPTAVEPSEPDDRIKWRQDIERFKAKGTWYGSGFPPDDPSCHAPLDLLVEFGYREAAA
jgi:hypothetical protein